MKQAQPRNLDLIDLSVRLARRRAAVEIELISAMFIMPGPAAALAEELGIDAGCFDQDDMRLMFAACCVAGHLPLPQLQDLIRRALIIDDLWGESDAAPASSVWHDQTLAVFTEPVRGRWAHPDVANLAAVIGVTKSARELLALIRRQRDASDHLAEAVRQLGGRPLEQLNPTRYAAELVRVARLTELTTVVLAEQVDRLMQSTRRGAAA